MIKVIHKITGCKLLGVGDIAQAIYGFRNARYKNTEDFIDIFKCKVYNMGYNFRSAIDIVKSSEKLIKNNKITILREVRAARDIKGIVREEKCKDKFDEIHKIIYKIFQNPNSKIAILYRNRTHKNNLEFELKKNKIKYTVNDSSEISDRSAIRTMFSCIRIASGQADIYDLDFAAKGLKGLGTASVEKIKELIAKRNKKTVDVIKEMTLDQSNHKRLSSIMSLTGFYSSHMGEPLNILAAYIETLFIKSFDYQDNMRNFILEITKDYKINHNEIRDICNDLGLNNKIEENSDNRIELSTIHGAKGLEYDVVIMPFCDMFSDSGDNIEEERRLFYVGMTRAENKLYMSYSGDIPKFIKESLL
jgi:DNA helicase-2/ATP-dependent DNA helicase PcrA